MLKGFSLVVGNLDFSVHNQGTGNDDEQQAEGYGDEVDHPVHSGLFEFMELLFVLVVGQEFLGLQGLCYLCCFVDGVAPPCKLLCIGHSLLQVVLFDI